MSDGAPEWPGAGLFRVHMDPLVVAGGVGKGVDALLVDGDPLGCAQALAYGLLQGGCVVECGGHVYSSNFFMSLCGSFGAGAGPRLERCLVYLSATRCSLRVLAGGLLRTVGCHGWQPRAYRDVFTACPQ